MEYNELINILPPVFTSIGGLIPLLLRSSPIPIAESDRPLASVIFVVGVWIIYLLVLMAGEAFTFYSSIFTLIFLFLGMIPLTYLFTCSVRKRKIKAHQASIFFLSGMLMVLIGLTNYVSSNGKSIFIFSINNKCVPISNIYWFNEKDKKYKMDIRYNLFVYGTVWLDNEKIKTIKKIKIVYKEKKEGCESTIEFPKMLHTKRGMGESYVYQN